jgi:hypothetical protein
MNIQDEHLDQIRITVQNVKEIGRVMGDELQLQSRYQKSDAEC